MTEHWVEILVCVVVAVLVALPPRWDPAIRWKEHNERKKRGQKRG